MKNIFVGNLDCGTSAESLQALFEAHGTIQSLRVMTDRETGRSRGFAFLQMPDEEAAGAIAALHGSILDGRTINVHEARPNLHFSGAPSDRCVPRL